MAKVELKKPVVEEIKAALDGAKAAVVVDHRGLTVEQDTQLRKTLREAGVSYKENPQLELKAGVVEGTYYDQDGIKVIATIPSRDELLSKFLGSIQSPITNFARVIKQIAEAQEEA